MMRVAICIVRLVFLVFLARHDMAVAASSKLQKIYPYPLRGAVLAPASINAVDLSIQQQQQQQQAKDATEAHPLSQSQLQSQVFPVAPIVPTTVVARDHRRSKREKGRLINSLAFLNGAADVITYRKYRCYGNMMTGNIVKLSSALAELRWHDAFFYGSLVMSYILGVALFRTFELQVPKIQPSLSFLSFRSKTPTAMKSTAIATIATRTIPTSLAVSPVIALVFLLADVLSFPHTKVIQMPLLSIAFGLLNAAATEATGGVITFAMTGHVAKVGQAAADYVFVERKWRKGSKTSARAIFAFVSGLTLTSVVMELLNKANSNGCSTLASIVTKCVLPFMGKITNSSMNNTKQPQ